MGIIEIILIVIGAGFGGGIGWLVKGIQTKVKINELENKVYKAEEARRNMIDELSKKKSELSKTKKLLNETIAAMEVLQAYKAIDEETQENLDKIKNSLNKDEEVTPETYEEFAKIIDNMNKENKEYNSDKRTE